MNTYAAIPICYKMADDGKHIRRVLISFTEVKTEQLHGYPVEFFSGTKLLAKDPYFDKPDSSHQYVFEDDGYILKTCDNDNKEDYSSYDELFEKRRYHVYLGAVMNPLSSAERKMCKIKAKDDEEAIKLFNNRPELKD